MALVKSHTLYSEACGGEVKLNKFQNSAYCELCVRVGGYLWLRTLRGKAIKSTAVQASGFPPMRAGNEFESAKGYLQRRTGAIFRLGAHDFKILYKTKYFKIVRSTELSKRSLFPDSHTKLGVRRFELTTFGL